MSRKSESVLFLHPSSDLYGADRSLLRTVRAVRELGVNILICLPYEGPLVDILKSEGFSVSVFNLAILRRKYFTPWGIVAFAFSFSFAFWRIYQLIKKENVKLIHSNTTAVVVGGVVAKLAGIKHLQHVREIIVSPSIIRIAISKLAFWFSDQVIAVSRPTVENLVKDEPRIRAKSVVINNGLELQKYAVGDRENIRRKYNIPENGILIGMIGRVSSWKGQDLFLDIAGMLLPENENLYFMAVGSPFQGYENLMDEFKQNAKKLSDPTRFNIVEFTPDVVDYLHAFDIFVLPSTLPDPFPTTALEAMATSRPMVANGQGGVCDMLEHETNGYLVKPVNQADKFSFYIKQLACNAELRAQVGGKAFQKVTQSFSEAAYKTKISECFKQFLEMH